MLHYTFHLEILFKLILQKNYNVIQELRVCALKSNCCGFKSWFHHSLLPCRLRLEVGSDVGLGLGLGRQRLHYFLYQGVLYNALYIAGAQ